MDLTYYRNSDTEKERTADLITLIPDDCINTALDIGARDGWFSILLAERFEQVVALDLEKPAISHPRIKSIKGNITSLDFDADEFDLVFCAEVLEHIPSKQLKIACSELQRVSKKYILIGVPFEQDIRVGRTRCYTCGRRNPPWGHVNSFDELKLKGLFPLCCTRKISFIGKNDECTNSLSEFFLDFAGNPYGDYDQEEPCVYCGAKLLKPPQRNILQKISTRIAFNLNNVQKHFRAAHPNWIHILFEKQVA